MLAKTLPKKLSYSAGRMGLWGMLVLLPLGGCGEPAPEPLGTFEAQSMLEDRTPDGGLFTSSTQSFLRGHHWLENIEAVSMAVGEESKARVTLESADKTHAFAFKNIPLDQLVPRLHYQPASPPDAFDAYNLMMAEYARNGLSMPVGQAGDTMAHFETTLAAEVPWKLQGDYTFDPNPEFRPYRVALINNCLKPGLWEISASDRAGEIYHSWFTVDAEVYHRLVAETNRVPLEFAADAVQWSVDTPLLALDRLRTVESEVGRFPLLRSSADEPVGYSSQDSRQKISKGFVKVKKGDEAMLPETLGEFSMLPVTMANFIEPGKYSYTDRKDFDLTFLAQPRSVDIRKVRPRTRYDWHAEERTVDHEDATHLEFALDFGELKILVGNLPVPLLVQQEDYVLYGFGVGILAAQDLAERRRYLIDRGPAPAFAYLAQEKDGAYYGQNSHDIGIEQIFIRTRPFVSEPHWEITITSYERIVDLVKFRIDIPPQLLKELQASSEVYVSPLYFTYADDNVR